MSTPPDQSRRDKPFAVAPNPAARAAAAAADVAFQDPYLNARGVRPAAPAHASDMAFNSAPNPYVARRAELAGTGDESELADRFTRWCAAMIDVLIYSVAGLPFVVFTGRPVALGLALAVFIGLLAWNAVLLARHGQTIGKKALGIRIVRNDGSEAGFARLFWLRMVLFWVFNIVPFAGALFGLVNILFIFRADRRCLHDLLAGTKVVVAQTD